MAEEVGGVGTRVKDPLLFTRFLADSAKELDDQYAPVDPNDDPVSRLSREVQLLEQGHIRPEQASPDAIALMGQRQGSEPSDNPFGMARDFGKALPQAAPWLGGATLTAMYPVSLAGSGAATMGAEKAGLGPNWQTAAGIVGGVADGPRAVMGARKVAAPLGGIGNPLAGAGRNIAKPTQKLGTAAAQAEQAAIKAEGQILRGTVNGQQVSVPVEAVGSDVTPPAGAVQPPTAVEKLIRAIKTEKPMRGPTERMRSIERARRAGAGAAELERLSDPETAFQAALGKQRGQLPTAAANGLSGTDFTRDDVAQLLNQIRGHGRLRFYEKISTRTALYKAINYAAGETDQLPGPREFELLEEVFGRDLASALQSRKGNLGRIALEIMGIPKTLRSSFDLSAPMRQGVFLSARHPKEWLEAWVPMFKSLKSDRAALESYERILADPDYQEIVGSVIPSRQRIAIVNPTGDALSMGARSANEEVFISRLANKIPGIRASNRAYSTYLNELRYNVAKTTLNNWKKAGVEITPEKMDMLGQFINISTGRGRLGKLEQIAPALNATFWSPRLLSSRFETPTLALQALKAGDKEIARLAAEELVAFVGMGVTALTLINLSGIGRVELDPRSPDFGKIRVGGTSIDFWGGFQQMARYTAQFMTSERKPLTKDDVLVDPAKAGMEPVQRSEIAFNFLRSKLAPGVPSLLANEMTNRTFTGDKLSETVTDKRTAKKTTVQTKRPALGLKDAPEINTRLDEAIQQLVPLFGLELTRAIENDGWQGLATTAPGVTGIGVQSIPTTDARQAPTGSYTDPSRGPVRIR